MKDSLSSQFTTANDVQFWKYRAEGGGHLLLISIDSPRMILRIPKYHPSFGRSAEEQRIFANRNLRFLSHVMGKWYDEYTIGNSSIVNLEEEFLSGVIVAFSTMRPSGRKKKPLQLAAFGYLEANIFQLVLRNSQSTATVPIPSISWEIKIKSGLKSYSPFLTSTTIIKRSIDRFRLTQYYKEYITHCKSDQNTELAWGKFQQMSNYSPSDLCSNDLAHIQRALTALLETPQNNLGIFYNGILCYGWNIVSSIDYQQKLQEFLTFFPSLSSTESSNEQILYQIIAKVLDTERIASRIELMQCLDFIDSEGSQYCYQRGLQYFSSIEEFHDYLVEFMTAPLDSSFTILASLLREVHYSTCDSTCISQWLESLDTISLPPTTVSLVKLYIISRMNYLEDMKSDLQAFTMDSLQQDLQDKAKNIINHASLEDLSLLLKLWMIASIAKDCSVIISLQPGQGPLSISDEDNDDVVIEPASASSEGIGKIHFSRSFHIFFLYRVNIIDIGLKDFGKFITKRQKDEEICQAYHAMKKIENNN